MANRAVLQFRWEGNSLVPVNAAAKRCVEYEAYWAAMFREMHDHVNRLRATEIAYREAYPYG